MWSSGWVGGRSELLFPFGYRWEADLLTVTYLRSSLPFEHRRRRKRCAALLPRSIIFCLILLAPIHRDAEQVLLCLLPLALCFASCRERSISSGVRNSLCHHPVNINTCWCYDSVVHQVYPDLGFSLCKIWDWKNVDNGRRTEAKEENFFFFPPWISGMFIGLLIIPCLDAVFSLSPNQLCDPECSDSSGHCFSSLHLCQVIYQKESLALPPLESNVSYSVKSTADASC